MNRDIEKLNESEHRFVKKLMS